MSLVEDYKGWEDVFYVAALDGARTVYLDEDYHMTPRRDDAFEYRDLFEACDDRDAAEAKGYRFVSVNATRRLRMF